MTFGKETDGTGELLRAKYKKNVELKRKRILKVVEENAGNPENQLPAFFLMPVDELEKIDPVYVVRLDNYIDMFNIGEICGKKERGL
jgi:hypothetical protein